LRAGFALITVQHNHFIDVLIAQIAGEAGFAAGFVAGMAGSLNGHKPDYEETSTPRKRRIDVSKPANMIPAYAGMTAGIAGELEVVLAGRIQFRRLFPDRTGLAVTDRLAVELDHGHHFLA
jgi:hypothetical protein